MKYFLIIILLVVMCSQVFGQLRPTTDELIGSDTIMLIDGSNASEPIFINMTATGTFKIPIVTPTPLADGMIWISGD